MDFNYSAQLQSSATLTHYSQQSVTTLNQFRRCINRQEPSKAKYSGSREGNYVIWGKGVTAPRILNRGTRHRRVASFTSWWVYTRGRATGTRWNNTHTHTQARTASLQGTDRTVRGHAISKRSVVSERNGTTEITSSRLVVAPGDANVCFNCERPELRECYDMLTGKVTDVSENSSTSVLRVTQWNEMFSVLLFFPSLFLNCIKWQQIGKSCICPPRLRPLPHRPITCKPNTHTHSQQVTLHKRGPCPVSSVLL